MGDCKLASKHKKHFQKLSEFKEDQILAKDLFRDFQNIEKDLKSEISDGRKIDSCEDNEKKKDFILSNKCIFFSN